MRTKSCLSEETLSDLKWTKDQEMLQCRNMIDRTSKIAVNIQPAE